MKKMIAMLLTLILTMTCAAYADEMIRVGIIQMADNGAFTDMREGFIDRMRELGYDESRMTFTYRNALGDMTQLVANCEAALDDGIDVAVTIATPPTQAFHNLGSGVPQFFISVSNPVGAGVITDMAHPDMNATGTSNAIPVSEMFKLAALLTPDCKVFGLIYCQSEINSVTTANQAKAYMDANGIRYVEFVVTNVSEVQMGMDVLLQEADAIFVPNDSVIQTAMAVVADSAAEYGVPVYGSSAVMVQSGAFATISIGDRQIGAITADMLHAYLTGTPIEEIPAVVVDDFTMVINLSTAEMIGVEIPQEILETAVIVE
ncbi:MAG: ABC transporter substrate-binding protein [Clostridia bacterium]|nr:ABC transporter substrate-binding protein [Clostridia bacterium]MBR6667809.1 ABC transporter substrate-binding protein [Clostridia bacterium]